MLSSSNRFLRHERTTVEKLYYLLITRAHLKIEPTSDRALKTNKWNFGAGGLGCGAEGRRFVLICGVVAGLQIFRANKSKSLPEGASLSSLIGCASARAVQPTSRIIAASPLARPAIMSSEDAPATEAITFTVKSSNDAKYTVSIASHASVAELKIKLAEVADVPVERQRLIYSGRVLKNEETLDFYKVKSGNTVHMVKSAASTASTQGSSAGPASSGVPNMASGTANNPLAGLTGARYAGQVQLPGAEMFGADGGVGSHPTGQRK